MVTSNDIASNFNSELYHHGIKGMKWGVRRYQNSNGSYTAAGKKRYADGSSIGYKLRNKVESSQRTIATKRAQKEAYKKTQEYQEAKKAKVRKAVKVGAAVAGTALAAYGTYKLAEFVQNKRSRAAIAKAQEYVDSNIIKAVGEVTFTNGKQRIAFQDGKGRTWWSEVDNRKSINELKKVGKQNAKTIATARQMYKDATNTKLDKGLSKIVNAGNAVLRKTNKR